MKRVNVAVLAPVLLALLAGCGSSKKVTTAASLPTSGGTASTSASAATSSTPSASPAVLITTKQGKLGTILAYGPKRLTVYLFEADKGPASSCTGECASVWPPVTGHPQAGGQAASADLGTISGANGSTQVTYKGHPLYLYSRDKDDGDTYGQGLTSFGASWYVLAPTGNKVDTS